MDEHIVGSWAGRSKSGDLVRYDFRADGSVVWMVASADSPGGIEAKYVVNACAEPPEMDIFDFEMPELKGFRFLAIYRHEPDGGLRFYGEPRRTGDMEPRPRQFSIEAIVLRRQPVGDALTE
jgi:hypothetical protein